MQSNVISMTFRRAGGGGRGHGGGVHSSPWACVWSPCLRPGKVALCTAAKRSKGRGVGKGERFYSSCLFNCGFGRRRFVGFSEGRMCDFFDEVLDFPTNCWILQFPTDYWIVLFPTDRWIFHFPTYCRVFLFPTHHWIFHFPADRWIFRRIVRYPIVCWIRIVPHNERNSPLVFLCQSRLAGSLAGCLVDWLAVVVLVPLLDWSCFRPKNAGPEIFLRIASQWNRSKVFRKPMEID